LKIRTGLSSSRSNDDGTNDGDFDLQKMALCAFASPVFLEIRAASVAA
jgi:hypothetical protein